MLFKSKTYERWTEPMLAATVELDRLDSIQYPMYSSPKLDGIRALHVDEKIVSRNKKPIRNVMIQDALRRQIATMPRIEGYDNLLLDGELMLFDKETMKPLPFREHSKVFMAEHGVVTDNAIWGYMLFDIYHPEHTFDIRSRMLYDLKTHSAAPNIHIVPQHVVFNALDAYSMYNTYMEAGFEGIMFKSTRGRYKCGRSTFKQGYMYKCKEFVDDEAVIEAVVLLNRNYNEAEVDNMGRTKRSKHTANMVQDANMMGKLICRRSNGDIVEIGTGFTNAERQQFLHPHYIGKTIVFKYFNYGGNDKARHPVYVGLREDV